MLEGFEKASPGPLQQLAERRPGGQLGAQDDSVDEQADDRLQLRPDPAGDRHAHHHVRVVAVASDEQREDRLEEHEEGHVGPLAELLDAGSKVLVEPPAAGAPAVGLPGRPGPIERHGVDLRRPRQPLAPVPDLAFENLALEPAPLPGRVVGVLDRQGRQGRGPSLAEAGVERRELRVEHAERPGVAGDVVEADEESRAFVREDHHVRREHQIPAEVERELGHLLDQSGDLLLAARLGQASQVAHGQHRLVLVENGLAGRAAFLRHHGAQRVMPRDQGIEGPAQSLEIHAAGQSVGAGGLVLTTALAQAVDVPEPLLAVGQRHPLRRPGGGELADGGRIEPVAGRLLLDPLQVPDELLAVGRQLRAQVTGKRAALDPVPQPVVFDVEEDAVVERLGQEILESHRSPGPLTEGTCVGTMT